MERRFKIDADSLPDLAGMMLAVADALRAIGGSASIEELDEKVIEQEGLTEEEQSFVMRNDENKPRVNYYLSWARTYLKRGGALENSKRGVWALTEKGQSLTTYEQATDIYEQVQREERERARKNGWPPKCKPQAQPMKSRFQISRPSLSQTPRVIGDQNCCRRWALCRQMVSNVWHSDFCARLASRKSRFVANPATVASTASAFCA